MCLLLIFCGIPITLRNNTRAINSNHAVITFQIPNKRSDLSGNVFSVRAAIFWNDLPLHVKKGRDFIYIQEKTWQLYSDFGILFRPFIISLLRFLRVYKQ